MGAASSPAPLCPPFLGQNEFDGYSVTAICARRWHSVIYTLFSLKSKLYSRHKGCFSTLDQEARQLGTWRKGGV